MARIYKMSDRIPVKIHDLKVKIAPLSYEVKSVCQGMIISGNHMQAAVHALKNALKEVNGLENADGSSYELEFENGELTSTCIDELLNVQWSNEIQMVAISLLQGVPKEFTDPSTGKPLEGVTFAEAPKAKKAKR